ncbi:hypothetical protein MAR_035744 [Mya arenaria]|uniref:Uncharacterized protein n=1 Tax=Mya arenaria TaxID=6604 RepID=A0ABY7EL06_MYAAR|nr:hypothetical protein MAR_035744 [Mya arenaria]
MDIQSKKNAMFVVVKGFSPHTFTTYCGRKNTFHLILRPETNGTVALELTNGGHKQSTHGCRTFLNSMFEIERQSFKNIGSMALEILGYIEVSAFSFVNIFLQHFVCIPSSHFSYYGWTNFEFVLRKDILEENRTFTESSRERTSVFNHDRTCSKVLNACRVKQHVRFDEKTKTLSVFPDVQNDDSAWIV